MNSDLNSDTLTMPNACRAEPGKHPAFSLTDTRIWSPSSSMYLPPSQKDWLYFTLRFYFYSEVYDNIKGAKVSVTLSTGDYVHQEKSLLASIPPWLSEKSSYTCQENLLTRPLLSHTLNSALRQNQQNRHFHFSASHPSAEIQYPVFKIITFPTIHFLRFTVEEIIWGSHFGKVKIALCAQWNSLTINWTCFGCFLTEHRWHSNTHLHAGLDVSQSFRNR